MSPNEFIKHYNLHDSLIEKISFNESLHELIINLDFAYWMQDNYDINSPEIGPLKLKLSGIQSFEINQELNLSDYTIDEAILVDNKLKISLIDDLNNLSLVLNLSPSEITII